MSREVEGSRYLSELKTRYAERDLVHPMLDTCEVEAPNGKHQRMVFEPLVTRVVAFSGDDEPAKFEKENPSPCIVVNGRTIYMTLSLSVGQMP